MAQSSPEGGLTEEEIAALANNGFATQSSDQFNPWSSPADHKSQQRVRLTQENCSELKILDYQALDHMAKVECTGGNPQSTAAGAAQLWVNLDALSCFQSGRDSEGRYENGCFREQSGTIATSSLAKSPESLRRITDRINQTVVETARKKVEEVTRKASQDYRILKTIYSRMSAADSLQSLAKGEGELIQLNEKLVALYGPRCDQVASAVEKRQEEPDIVRGQSDCRLVRGSLALAKKLLKTDNPNTGSEPAEAVAKSLRNFLSKGDPKNGTPSYESLVLRQMLFQGLPANKQKAIAQSGGGDDALRLVRAARELDGAYLLHNGYVYGGSAQTSNKSGTDCSEFISMILLSGKPGAAAIRTDSFRLIALALDPNDGIDVRLPKALRPFARCMEPVDLRAGEALQPGDFVVSRNNRVQNSGHIVVVEKFNEDDGTIQTLEASGSGGSTVGSRVRPIFEPSCGSGTRPLVRPDLSALRFKEGCDIGLR